MSKSKAVDVVNTQWQAEDDARTLARATEIREGEGKGEVRIG
jgi:hypothetical protein